MTLFYVLIGILLFDFVFERILSLYNKRHLQKGIPEELDTKINEQEFNDTIAYKTVNYKFGLLTALFSFALIMLMLFLNGFAYIDEIAKELSSNNIIIAMIFFGILFFASDLINLPFSVYDTFIIEKRFGFNKSTPKLFISDKLKGWLLAIIIGGILLSVIIFIYNATREYFWILSWGVIVLFSVFMNVFYTTLILPLFNKLSPLEDGELKTSILRMCEKTGFTLDNVYIIDGSKRSTKANAYFSGLGKRKKIVLYDTLLNDLYTEEIVAVLNHEIGHFKKKHIIKGLVSSFLQTGITLYLFSIFVDNDLFAQALGAEKASFHLGVITFGILYHPISLVTGIMFNYFSRKNEFEADAFAKKFGGGEALISALLKLTKKNLSDINPHPFYVFVNYSHPTLIQRIKFLK